MSSDTIVAKRYAKALFEAAQEQGVSAQVQTDLQSVVGIIAGNSDFEKLLQHPNIDSSVKVNLVKEAFAGKVSELVFNTLQLLITRRRESLLEDLLGYYSTIANDALGQANAKVSSPYALSDKEEKAISEQFGKLTGKKIAVETIIDPSLLGGIQVRIGDRLYDGSFSGKLARLQKTLKQTKAL